MRSITAAPNGFSSLPSKPRSTGSHFPSTVVLTSPSASDELEFEFHAFSFLKVLDDPEEIIGAGIAEGLSMRMTLLADQLRTDQ